MVFLRSAALLATAARASNWGDGNGKVGDVPASFDCAMRKAAYDFGKKLVPRQGSFEALYYALDLNSDDCHVDYDAFAGPKADDVILPADAVYVAPGGAGDGAAASPLGALQAAYDLAASRASKTVVLRGGTHYVQEPVLLTRKHSGLRVVAYPGEAPKVSGGVELDVAWKRVKGSDVNLYVSDVDVDDVPGLQIDGVRSTRARYPNLPGGLEVSCGYGCMIPSANATWTPPDFDRFGEVEYFTDNRSDTLRDDTPDGWFQRYMVGREGLCSVYDPPVSYWCSEKPSGGGAFAFRTPSGVAIDLPNAPYADAGDALFFVWRPARWANWMFEVAAERGGNYTFGRGGNQGARGSDDGGDFFVENVFEELDYPNEFFFDKKAKKLYLVHNGTGAPPDDATVVATKQRVLLNVSGTQWDPVRDVKHEGVTFTSTRYTYMDPHGVPSAGDWALDRVAAVFLQGTEGVTFDKCAFDRLDGNAVMVSGYNRGATIVDSDFSFVGGNAVAAWGYTNETATDPGRPGVVNENWPAAGVDGTDGEHPVGTTVRGCTAREVGLYEKQSSFYVQAKTAASKIEGNVFFNGARRRPAFLSRDASEEIGRSARGHQRERRLRRRRRDRAQPRLQHVPRERRPRALQLLGPPAVPDDAAHGQAVDDHGVARDPPQLLHRQLLAAGGRRQRRRLLLLQDARQLPRLRRPGHEERLRGPRQPPLQQHVRVRRPRARRDDDARGPRGPLRGQQGRADELRRRRAHLRRAGDEDGRQRLLHARRETRGVRRRARGEPEEPVHGPGLHRRQAPRRRRGHRVGQGRPRLLGMRAPFFCRTTATELVLIAP